MSKNGNNNNGPALPPGITAEIWEQMKKQQRRGPVPPATEGQAVAQPQPQKQQPHQQPKQQQAAVSGKSSKGKRVVVQIREANPVAVSNTGSYEAIEIDSGVGNESDEWKTVTTKRGRKKAAGDDVPVGDKGVEKVTAAVNGLTIAGEKKKKKKKPAVKEGSKAPATAPAPPSSQAVTAARKGSVDGKKQQSGPALVSQQAPPAHKDQELEVDGDPVKRLRNLKKRLKEIEQLRQKDKSTLGADQVEKMKRYSEVKKQIAILEARVN